MAGEPAAMSPAIQHHVLGFSHLLHSSWPPAEGAFSLRVLGPPCGLIRKKGVAMKMSDLFLAELNRCSH